MDPLIMNYLARAIQQEQIDRATERRLARQFRTTRTTGRAPAAGTLRRAASWFDHAVHVSTRPAH